jgi:L-rhamnose 1-dehydrogenase
VESDRIGTNKCLRRRLDQDLFKFTVETNLHGAFYATQAAARQMAQQNAGGSIIGVSSISALVGGGLQTHYTPTKAGVLSLMQSCACALGKYKIRCNALLPGTIKTQLNEKDLADDKKREYMEGRIPLGRTGVPSDLAGPAVFLASDLSSYVVCIPILIKFSPT